MVISAILVTTVLLSKREDKDEYILWTIFIFLAFNIFFYGKKLCLYRDSSPKWLKIGIFVFSTVAMMSLLYLLTSIFLNSLPFIDVIDIILSISFGGYIILALIEKFIFNVEAERDIFMD